MLLHVIFDILEEIITTRKRVGGVCSLISLCLLIMSAASHAGLTQKIEGVFLEIKIEG